jgi:hypothetical protein
MWHHYELGSSILKTDKPLTLWKSDRGSVDIEKDTLAIAFSLEGRPEGYVFSGSGKMILDAIVETDQGAVGKPIERQIQQPFVMIGKLENPESRSFSTVADDQTGFMAKAQDVFAKFCGREHFDLGSCHRHDGLVFAFSNDFGKFDLLIPNGSKIVYKSKQTVFISDEDNTILKNPEQTVVSNHGKCIVMNGRC